MLVQPPTVPDRVPYASTVIPVQFAEPDARPGLLAGWETEFARIPQAIRDELTAPYIDEAGALNRLTYRFGSAAWLMTGPGVWIGWGPSTAGLYGSAGGEGSDGAFLRGRIGCYTDGTQAGTFPIVHEFGHHIDRVLRPLRGAAWSPTSALNWQSPFAEVWAAHNADIPSPLYGKTNIREWFAEQWRCQIQGDGTMFLQLMGGNRIAADTIRAEWVSMFPSMPAFTY